jgi:hypothetical protein
MKTVTLPLDKLIAYAGNPRKNDHAVEAVAAAIKRFGFRVPVLAKSDGSLIDGHLRVKAAKHLGMDAVPVVLCDDLSEADIKALRISINRMAELAEWDVELLSTELEGLTAEGYTLDDVGFDADALEQLGVSEDIFEDKDNPYTAKVEAPIYKPTGQKPTEADLCNQEKFKALLSDIKNSNLPKEQKTFLELAAARHIVFDYQQIAEYYAHATPELQKLMEDSALIIIDFKKAIEAGFVKLTDRVADQFKRDIDNE